MNNKPETNQIEIRRNAKSVDDLLARITRAINPSAVKVRHLSIPILVGNPDTIPLLWSYQEELDGADAIFRTPAPEERVMEAVLEELDEEELDRIVDTVTSLSDQYKNLVLNSYVLPQLAIQMAMPEVSSILASAITTPSTASPITFDSSGVSKNLELLLFIQLLERFSKLCPDLPKDIVRELQSSIVGPASSSPLNKMMPKILRSLSEFAKAETSK
jgi:hypothetical protein